MARLPSSVIRRLTRAHVLAGIRDFEEGRVEHRFAESTTYDLLVDGNRYPPKAVVGLAGRHCFGRVLTPEDLGGGEGTATFRVLRQLGFEVVRKREPPFFADEVERGTYPEGGAVRVLVNRYERSRAARRACIDAHGSACHVCLMRFADTYPAVADDYIHVHHLAPLSKLEKAYELDPVADLRPVCPNCHAMLHRRDPPFTIEEMRRLRRPRSAVRARE
jgi:5-methylcytosine-specific restriction enzyme A